jgi:hypothetical protein
MRNFHQLKCQAMRQRFGDQMRALRMTLSSNHELLERLAQAHHRQAVTKEDFKSTAQQMSLAELKIEEKVAEAEAHLENRQRLQNWKRNKARQLAHIDQKVRDHQRVGTVDVEGNLRDIQEKTELLERLKLERSQEELAVGRKVAEFQDQTDKLHNIYKTKRHGKDAARENLDRWRSEAESSTMTDEQRVMLWHRRIAAAKESLASLEAENKRLKKSHQAMAHGGMDDDD